MKTKSQKNDIIQYNHRSGSLYNHFMVNLQIFFLSQFQELTPIQSVSIERVVRIISLHIIHTNHSHINPQNPRFQ